MLISSVGCFDISVVFPCLRDSCVKGQGWVGNSLNRNQPPRYDQVLMRSDLRLRFGGTSGGTDFVDRFGIWWSLWHQIVYRWWKSLLLIVSGLTVMAGGALSLAVSKVIALPVFCVGDHGELK